MRIVYVEDNQMNLALVERVARVGGHEVISFSNGETALEALKIEACDLILMDIELEGPMDGTQVVQHLRARGDKRPVIAVTAYAMAGDKERILAAGCDDYLPKPVPIAQFLSLLAKYDPRNTPPVVPARPAQAVAPARSGTGPLPSLGSQPALKALGETSAVRPDGLRPVATLARDSELQSPKRATGELPAIKPEATKQPPALDLRPPPALPPKEGGSSPGPSSLESPGASNPT
jgi:two-component system cell cycle response regulator DivK